VGDCVPWDCRERGDRDRCGGAGGRDVRVTAGYLVIGRALQVAAVNIQFALFAWGRVSVW
jgi:hypothetical protein